MAAASPPPLPKIAGDVDLFLDVFTHNSLRMHNAPMNEEYGNTDRLALLGATVLRLVVATHFFRKKPQLNSKEINVSALPSLSSAGFADLLQEEVDFHLTDKTVDEWMSLYNLKTKIRIAPSEMDKIHDVKEMRKVFETYVGALFIRNGLDQIESWIARLIDPDAEEPAAPVSSPSVSTSTAPSASKYSYTSGKATSYSSFGQASSSFQPSSAPKSPAASASFPPPYSGMGGQFQQGQSTQGGSGGSFNVVSVALLNQKAMQLGYQVTYPAESTGPPHNPLWTVRCCRTYSPS